MTITELAETVTVDGLAELWEILDLRAEQDEWRRQQNGGS